MDNPEKLKLPELSVVVVVEPEETGPEMVRVAVDPLTRPEILYVPGNACTAVKFTPVTEEPAIATGIDSGVNVYPVCLAATE